MSLTGKSPSETYKDLTYVDNNNSGVDSTTRSVKTGNGSETSLSLSDRAVKIKSSTDNTAALDVQNSSGTSKLLVDTTNSQVKALGTHVNTQYAQFGIGSGDSVWAGASANRHYAVPFNSIATQAIVDGGSGTDPVASYADGTGIATTADDMVACYWYIMDNITIDRVVWWSGGDAATGEATRTHLMSYTVDSGNSATSGDLSSGAVVAYSSDVTNAGYEQAYYNQMTISTADVDAGKVLMFFFRADSTVNSDYSINATVKYHLR